MSVKVIRDSLVSIKEAAETMESADLNRIGLTPEVMGYVNNFIANTDGMVTSAEIAANKAKVAAWLAAGCGTADEETRKAIAQSLLNG
jgi:hypothetical protein